MTGGGFATRCLKGHGAEECRFAGQWALGSYGALDDICLGGGNIAAVNGTAPECLAKDAMGWMLALSPSLQAAGGLAVGKQGGPPPKDVAADAGPHRHGGAHGRGHRRRGRA